MSMNEKKNVSNDEIYKALMNLSAQNIEIKEEIRSLKTNLETKTTEIRREYEKLKEENRELKYKLRITERRAKKNNIIIYNCREAENENTVNRVLELANEKLNVELTVSEINNAYRIGVKDNEKIRPIRLELISYLKKTEINSQGRRLKGSSVYMRDDLTPEDLDERKLLIKHLAYARKNNIPAKINKFNLIVNGETYSYQDLEKTPLDDNDDVQIDITNLSPPPNRRNQSAPATPTVSSEEALFPDIISKEEKSKDSSKSPSNNVHGITPGFSGMHNRKKSSSGDNVRSSERIAKSINKKP